MYVSNPLLLFLMFSYFGYGCILVILVIFLEFPYFFQFYENTWLLELAKSYGHRCGLMFWIVLLASSCPSPQFLLVLKTRMKRAVLSCLARFSAHSPLLCIFEFIFILRFIDVAQKYPWYCYFKTLQGL
jgi:hypothetical protein